MAKLSKKERQKIELQMAAPADRGNTWVGCRPTVMDNKKYNKKLRRSAGKDICRAYC